MPHIALCFLTMPSSAYHCPALPIIAQLAYHCTALPSIAQLAHYCTALPTIAQLCLSLPSLPIITQLVQHCTFCLPLHTRLTVAHLDYRRTTRLHSHNLPTTADPNPQLQFAQHMGCLWPDVLVVHPGNVCSLCGDHGTSCRRLRWPSLPF